MIGEQARCRSLKTATSAVVGYSCIIDLSNRNDQAREQNWVRRKAFDGAAPLGPVVAPPAAVPADVKIALQVNGETRQEVTRSELVFSMPELIAEITQYCVLEPGDVITTGTPAGAGPLQPGGAMQ